MHRVIVRKVSQNTTGQWPKNEQIVNFCDDLPDDAQCEVVGGGWSRYSFPWWCLCLTKSYLRPQSEPSDRLSRQKHLLLVVKREGDEEETTNETVPSVWLILSSPCLLYLHWSTTAEIHLSRSPPMGAQCGPGEPWRPMGGPDPPGLPPACLPSSWLSSHSTLSRCQHTSREAKYFILL